MLNYRETKLQLIGVLFISELTFGAHNASDNCGKIIARASESQALTVVFLGNSSGVSQRDKMHVEALLQEVAHQLDNQFLVPREIKVELAKHGVMADGYQLGVIKHVLEGQVLGVTFSQNETDSALVHEFAHGIFENTLLWEVPAYRSFLKGAFRLPIDKVDEFELEGLSKRLSFRYSGRALYDRAQGLVEPYNELFADAVAVILSNHLDAMVPKDAKTGTLPAHQLMRDRDFSRSYNPNWTNDLIPHVILSPCRGVIGSTIFPLPISAEPKIRLVFEAIKEEIVSRIDNKEFSDAGKILSIPELNWRLTKRIQDHAKR